MEVSARKKFVQGNGVTTNKHLMRFYVYSLRMKQNKNKDNGIEKETRTKQTKIEVNIGYIQHNLRSTKVFFPQLSIAEEIYLKKEIFLKSVLSFRNEI